MCKKHIRISMNDEKAITVSDDNLLSAVNQAAAVTKAHGKCGDLYLFPQETWLGTANANGTVNLTPVAKKL